MERGQRQTDDVVVGGPEVDVDGVENAEEGKAPADAVNDDLLAALEERVDDGAEEQEVRDSRAWSDANMAATLDRSAMDSTPATIVSHLRTCKIRRRAKLNTPWIRILQGLDETLPRNVERPGAVFRLVPDVHDEREYGLLGLGHLLKRMVSKRSVLA